MARKSIGGSFLDWLIPPRTLKLNKDTQLLKLIAMLAMLIDHLGAVVFPQYRFMRIIGRMAFPLYAYCLVAGCIYTKDILRYIERIALLLLVSQPLYVVVMNHMSGSMYAVSFAESPVHAAFNFYLESFHDPSILFTLLIGLILLWSIRDRKFIITACVGIFLYFTYRIMDYSWRGIVLMLLLYLFSSRPILSMPLVTAFMIWWGMQGNGYSFMGISFGIQMFAIFALPLIYIPTNSRIKLPKFVFYLFYPAHLLLVWGAKILF